MTYQSIRLEKANGYATLTLCRPDKLNSFTAAMHREIRDALSDIEADKTVRALLVTGEGRGFCAGQDLADPEFSFAPDSDVGEALERDYNPLVTRLRALPFPVICAVNGVAAGAGANFALAGDIVLVAKSATFIQAFCKIGLVPDAGGTYSLVRLAGEARAKGMALLGLPVSAEQALQWGLVWQVCEDDRLMEDASKLAAHLATQPTRVLGLIKSAIQSAATNDMAAQLDLEIDYQRQAAATDDFREGVAAFLEKRPARFTGH